MILAPAAGEAPLASTDRRERVLLDAASAIGGLILLILAADRLVVSAVRISRALGVSTILIGAVIVGFGTSAPEFLVSGLGCKRRSLGSRGEQHRQLQYLERHLGPRCGSDSGHDRGTATSDPARGRPHVCRGRGLVGDVGQRFPVDLRGRGPVAPHDWSRVSAGAVGRGGRSAVRPRVGTDRIRHG